MKNKIILSFVVILLPVLVSAQNILIPCDGVAEKCDFNALMRLVSNVINYLGWIALPLAVISITFAGGKIMMAGSNVGERKAGIAMMWKVVQGFAVLLAAWLIVKTVLLVLINDAYLQYLPLKL